MHPVEIIAERFPQMYFPIREGIKDTQEYKNAVLRGEDPKYSLNFSMNTEDRYDEILTPAGTAEVIYLADRSDFEHCIRALAYRCEPREIPQSMGASTISGLINWVKIKAHEDDLDVFLSEKSNYLDTVIVLSGGPYSAVSAKVMNLSEDEWIEKSITIRKYHELTHFVSRKLFLENKEEIRDEIVADMIGIISAFGYYNTKAARLFLGIEDDEYREGGRLQNYSDPEKLQQTIIRANELIDIFDNCVKNMKENSVFDLLKFVECNKIGI